MNKSKEKIIKKKINELDGNEDIEGLDKFYNEVLTLGSAKLKQELAEAYLSIKFVYAMDYHCGKIEGKETIFDMLEWIDKAEKLTPNELLNSYRGDCYVLLVEQVKQPEEKEKYINKSIEQYENQVKKNPQEAKAYTELAQAIFEKNIILKKDSSIDFEPILSLLSKAVELDLKTLETEKRHYLFYNSVSFTSFLHIAYKIATLPFDSSLKIHQHFLNEFNHYAMGYIKKDPFYHYIWAKTLGRVIDYNDSLVSHKNGTPQSKNFNIEIQKEIEDRLSHITSYTSKDQEKLCSLGDIFHKTAKNKKIIAYYEVALNYYLNAKLIDPNTWTYPVYATNALKGMALLHLETNNIKDAKTAFKTGKKIFAEAITTVGEDFTLFRYYGEFLYAYAQHIERFSNRPLLEEAEQKLLIAKRLGKKFYDGPYIYLAKVALKLDNKKKCIQILEECDHTFSNEYYTYDFRQVREDKDFDELKNNKKFQKLTNTKT